MPALGLDLIAQRLPAEHAAGIASMIHHAEHNDDRPMPPSTGGQPYEAYCDAAGALRPEQTLPRRQPTDATVTVPATGATAPKPTDVHDPAPQVATTSLLPADDQAYLHAAATTDQDLHRLAPRVPLDVAGRVEAADPTLDEDLASWRDPDCPLPRLTVLGPVQVRTAGSAPRRC